MTINIPDNEPLSFPTTLGVEEARRVLLQLGFTQVDGASASTDDDGNITFSRQAGGAKA